MSQNDPQWGGGNRGNDGPPDLEQIFRNVTRKFRGNHSGGDGNGFPSGGRGFKGGLVAIGGVLAALWLASGFYMIDAREEGVVLRFGEYHRSTDAGLQWHIPYPIEQVEVVSLTDVRSLEIGYRGNDKNRISEEALMVTSDLNIIDVQLSVQYDVLSARNFLFENACADRDCKDILKQIAESSIREVVGRNQVDFVLNEGRAKIASDTQVLIQQIVDRYQLGIRISKVNINNVQPPEPVLAAFDDAVKAGQDKDKLRNEGQAYANDVIPKAQGVAARLMQEAEGYKQRVIASAEGEAQRFSSVLSEYQKAPAVTRERLYLDTMQDILASTSKVFVDQKNGQNLLYLPLDKLMQQAKPGPTSTAPAANNETTPQTEGEVVAPAAANNGRDVVRNRDLGAR